MARGGMRVRDVLIARHLGFPINYCWIILPIVAGDIKSTVGDLAQKISSSTPSTRITRGSASR